MPNENEPDRLSALRTERVELLQFCSTLTDHEWSLPSCAAGWRVQDVVAHIGSGCHTLFTPASLAVLRSSGIERTNEDLVDTRRDWAPQDVLDEFAQWSSRVTRLAGIVASTPLTKLRVPLAELGKFRLGLLLGSAMVFDQHTHLRFDIAPAIGRAAPPTDANRMSVVVEWMVAVLANQLRADCPGWMDRPVRLTLTGLGGGSWLIGGSGGVRFGSIESEPAASLFAAAEEFPEWGTRRAAWRDRSVTVVGSDDYGANFLDWMNIV